MQKTIVTTDTPTVGACVIVNLTVVVVHGAAAQSLAATSNIEHWFTSATKTFIAIRTCHGCIITFRAMMTKEAAGIARVEMRFTAEATTVTT